MLLCLLLGLSLYPYDDRSPDERVEGGAMLPIGRGNGQIWLDDRFLCDVEYAINKPLKSRDHQVQRIIFTLEEEDCAPLLDAYGLALILADGSRHAIPRPLQQAGVGRLECYVESQL
jgi:hypothetical protein